MGYFYSPYYEVALVFALVLLVLAAPLHFSTRNTGTILYICWVFLANLITLINKLIWPDHVRNVAPALCDISQSFGLLFLLVRSLTSVLPCHGVRLAQHFLAGLHFSIGAVSIVINRRLFKVSRMSSGINLTPAQVRPTTARRPHSIYD